MPYLFGDSAARAQRQHRRLALQEKLPPGCALLGACVLDFAAVVVIADVHFELTRAVSENQLTGLWQIRFERIVDEGKKHVVMLGNAGKKSS